MSGIYKTRILKSVLYGTAALFAAIISVSASAQLTTVFVDDFERAAVSPGGVPSMTYTSTIGSGDVVNLTSVSGTSMLQIGTGSSGAQKTCSWTTGPIASYASQFNPILHNNLGTVTWSFNVQANNNPNTGTGFNSTGSYAVGIILCTNNSNPATMLTSGSGYALTATTSGSGDFDLVKFANGLSGTLTPIISTSGENGLSNYKSFQVSLDPSTDTWTLMYRSDGSSGPSDPSTGTFDYIGSIVDATYTSTAMSLFGYIWSHNNSTGKVAKFDNYRVTVNIPPPTISINSGTFNGNFGNIVVNTISAASMYKVSGVHLTAGIKVKAPTTDFKVSLSAASGFVDSFVIPQSAGNVPQTNVYVRYQPTAATGTTGPQVVANSSAGATTMNVGVSGNALDFEPTNIGTITFGVVTPTTIEVNLPTIGNGDKRIIVCKLGSPSAFVPTDGVALTGVNANFATATNQGNGSKVVYDGTGSGNSVLTVTGLDSGMLYYFIVYEYNVGTGTSHNYLLTPYALNNMTTHGNSGPGPILSVNAASKAEQISMYPNPVRDILYLNAPFVMNAVVRDIQGRTVFTGTNVKEISFSGLAAGTYILNILDEQQKLIRQEKLIRSN